LLGCTSGGLWVSKLGHDRLAVDFFFQALQIALGPAKGHDVSVETV
jgi:hypothetical protein